MSRLAVTHSISIPEPATHLVHVETTVAAAAGNLPAAVVLFMPVWTPGSYLIREYARHVEGFSVDRPATSRKIRKNAWRVETAGAATMAVRYSVYAAELTVRTNHVDDRHAFLVPAALFFGIEGHDAPAVVEISAPAGWRAATPLPHLSGDGDLRFAARDFDTLIDSPIELGTHLELPFDVLDVPHRYAIVPSLADEHATRLVADTRAIVETEAKLFGGSLPYESYDVILSLSPRGRGGLEHRSSAALIAPETSFATRDGYLDLLSLVAHEIFHAWNVKRIRPAGLWPYRYEEECYTRLLWWFEGATSYYDWRVLALARLCTADEYLDHLAGELTYLSQTHGRLVQSLEDASYDAWIKLYRPDENSTNSSVSYYRKGEIVCALLDLEIRVRSRGHASLDAVLRHLWDDYGARERPVPEDAMQSIFEAATKTTLGGLFDAWIRSPSEIDYTHTLAHVGLAVEPSATPDASSAALGIRVRSEPGRCIVVSVARGSAAWKAGIDAGDEIVAVGDVRIEGTSLDGALRGRAPGQSVDVVVSHDRRLVTKSAVLDAARPERMKIVPRRDASAAERDAFVSWLGLPFPAHRRTSP